MGNTAAMGVRPQSDLISKDRMGELRAGMTRLGDNPPPTIPTGGIVSDIAQSTMPGGTIAPSDSIVSGGPRIGAAPRRGGIIGGMAGGNMPQPIIPTSNVPINPVVPPLNTPVTTPTRVATPVKRAKGGTETDPYERWKQLGRPGGSFEGWKAGQ